MTKAKLGLSQPLHDCNDTHQADHVPESHFLDNNLGKMPKYQPQMFMRSNEVKFSAGHVAIGTRVGFGKNWHFEKTSKR